MGKNTRNANHLLPARTEALVQGERLTLYGVGWLAHLTNRTTKTVRLWERQGFLPRPIFDKQLAGKGNKRYYTAAELIGYCKIFNSIVRRPKIGIPKRTKVVAEYFKQQLTARLKTKDMGSLLPKLPNEAEIIASLLSRQDAKWKKAAHDILNEMKTMIQHED